jgi:hypothetical protein
MRWAKERDPIGYFQVLRRNPVNQHIARDEKSHEVELEADVHRIDRFAYQRWAEGAWE